MKPTGTQYLVFEALDNANQERVFSLEIGIWFIDVLSSITNVTKTIPDAFIQLMDYRRMIIDDVKARVKEIFTIGDRPNIKPMK